MKLPKTYVKKIREKDIDREQSCVANIYTITTLKHSLIPKISIYDEYVYEMEYIHGDDLVQYLLKCDQPTQRDTTFKLISQVSTLIHKMSKLKNPSYPDMMFIGKDMRNLGNYMMREDGRIVCIDFDSWRWWPTNEAIWHARNALSFPIEQLLISS
mgnify:CR=1 FL=1